MKVNKQIMLVTIIVMTISLIFLLLYREDSLWKDTIVGVFTGTVISFITALINYYNEKYEIWEDIKAVLPDIYINLCLISKLTGSLLPQIPYTAQLDGLNYRRILQLSEFNISFVLKCNIGLFSGILKNSKISRAIRDFAQYSEKLYNLKHCLGKVEISALEADALQKELLHRQASNFFVAENEYRLLNDKRYFVTVQSSKIHEYEASLLAELDKVAQPFYGRKGYSWDKKKGEMNKQVEKMLQEIGM